VTQTVTRASQTMLKDSDALLIVDVQADFLPGGALAVPSGDEVVPVLASVAAAFRQAGLPVVASRDWHPEDHCSFAARGGPWPPHCIAGTPGAELDPNLGLDPGTLIVDKATAPDKDAYSAFDGTGLARLLEDRGVTRVIVGGLATEYCVLNTARDAIASGFDLILLNDAIRAIDPTDGERAVAELGDLGALVLPSGTALQ